MKSWRERTVEAEARGHFNDEDLSDAESPRHCGVAEAIRNYGLSVNFTQFCEKWWYDPVKDRLRPLGGAFPTDIRFNDFAGAHRILDAIEDRALELKRSRVDEPESASETAPNGARR